LPNLHKWCAEVLLVFLNERWDFYMAEASAQRAESAAATVANPGPLGLSAFALTTFVLSAGNANLFTAASGVVGLALFYGGLVQLVAGVMEFRRNNTFAATAFCSYGGFWLAVGFDLWQPKLIGAGFSYFLLGWTIFTAMMFIGSFRQNMALVVVFALLLVTFALLTLGGFTGSSTFNVLGGIVGIVTALAAWYTALATVGQGVLNLPVGSRS
jgi:succinate-acetate transporter protein